MAANTSAFIEHITNLVNEFVPTTYDEAPTNGSFPYAVINGINIIPLSAGDLVSFFIDLHADERDPGAALALENLCDKLRNELTDRPLYVPGVFGGHIGFENQNGATDKEFDLFNRRLSFSARIFYN